jgi:hypothetical protein
MTESGIFFELQIVYVVALHDICSSSAPVEKEFIED